jgi:RimJ/RimL family protein N-acetyltransferase
VTTSASPVTVRTTPRLRLRELADGDRTPFARMNADPVVMAHYPATLSREESDALVDRVAATWKSHGYGLWAAERRDSGDLIGYVGLWPVPDTVPVRARPAPCIEVGWRLAAEHWGKGFATEGAHAAVRFAAEHLRVSELVSFTAVTNRRSRRVMERLGMVHDVEGDFEHPALPPGHRLRPHVLYRLAMPAEPGGSSAAHTPPASAKPTRR